MVGRWNNLPTLHAPCTAAPALQNHLLRHRAHAAPHRYLPATGVAPQATWVEVRDMPLSCDARVSHRAAARFLPPRTTGPALPLPPPCAACGAFPDLGPRHTRSQSISVPAGGWNLARKTCWAALVGLGGSSDTTTTTHGICAHAFSRCAAQLRACSCGREGEEDPSGPWFFCLPF